MMVEKLVRDSVLVPLLTHRRVGGIINGETVVLILKEFKRQVGPIGDKLLEKSATNLGYNIFNFPWNQVSELVELLANFIQDPREADDFKHKILAILI